ncbi:MAG: hypothetical protein KIT83_16140 [Bryobacterales bacterium]|nr:hypothetical protein [Bryobacterales bacterium]
MDITAEQSKRARVGNVVLTAFAAAMLLGLAFGPLMVIVISVTEHSAIANALRLAPLP